jgi:hypothetical protein
MLHLSEAAYIKAGIESGDRVIWIDDHQLVRATSSSSLACMLNCSQRIPEIVVDHFTFSAISNN